MPIFVLYFGEFLSLREIILLESIYFISVVILEVPSGYFSDLIGRKVTLLLSAVFLLLASTCFLLGSSFSIFVVGQICFAGWMAFQSGTNTVFHFESLKALGKEDEYGDREAYVSKIGFYAGGIAALLGGVLGIWDLRWAYVITMVAAVIGVISAFQFTEPDRSNFGEALAHSFGKQLSVSFKYFFQKPLGWLFGYIIFIYAIAHIPYEFYQPYLKLLEIGGSLGSIKAPPVSGLIYALTMFFGAYVSGKSMVLARSLGLKRVLFLALLLMIGVIAIMGLVLHPVIVLVILLRGAPRSLIKAPTNAIITPQVDSGQRATLFSLVSLICRLVFFLTLLGLSFFVPKEALTDWTTLSMVLMISAGGGIILGIPFLISVFKQRFETPQANSEQ